MSTIKNGETSKKKIKFNADLKTHAPDSHPLQDRESVSLSETGVFKLDIDKMIKALLENYNKEERVSLTMVEIQALAIVAREQLKLEPILLEITAPIRICGDIHGQFNDLIRIFNLAGYPPDKKYLFLGDYVDRGKKGLECICLLFAYKIKYPDKVYLLRGNHESEAVSRIYGFREEIVELFVSSKLWWTFLKTFNYMPLAAVVETKIFCCHGGISPEFMHSKFKSLNQDLNKIERPVEVPLKGMICDLLWADPLDQLGNLPPLGFVPNERGCSWSFGFDIVRNFLEKFDLDLIVRAHQVVEDGYEFYANRKLITIFSAPNYCGEFDNAGAILCLDYNIKDGESFIVDGGFLILKPEVKRRPLNWLKTLGSGIRHIANNMASR